MGGPESEAITDGAGSDRQSTDSRIDGSKIASTGKHSGRKRGSRASEGCGADCNWQRHVSIVVVWIEFVEVCLRQQPGMGARAQQAGIGQRIWLAEFNLAEAGKAPNTTVPRYKKIAKIARTFIAFPPLILSLRRRVPWRWASLTKGTGELRRSTYNRTAKASSDEKSDPTLDGNDRGGSRPCVVDLPGQL